MDGLMASNHAGTQMCFVSPLFMCGHPKFGEYSHAMLLLKVQFRAYLHKCWSLNFNLKKCSISLNDWLLTDFGHLFLPVIAVILFQDVSAGFQGFCLWDDSPIITKHLMSQAFYDGKDNLFWIRNWKCISFGLVNCLIIPHSSEQVFNSEK